MVSMSLNNLSWRPARSSSSCSMPLTSRNRRTARPAMARPSASIGRPERLVKASTKPRPSRRKVSTACSIRCAAIGSSQVPKASTRSGGPSDTIAVSPRISGRSAAAAQVTSICGSDNRSAFNRSASACKATISSCAVVSARSATRRARNSTTVANRAKPIKASTSVSSVISCPRSVAIA